MKKEIVKELAIIMDVLILSEMPVIFFGMDGTGLDEYPACSTSSQQLSVDMIYRFIKCGLVEFLPDDWVEDAGFKSIDDYFEKLASVDKNKKSTSVEGVSRQHALDMGVWLEPQLVSTDFGESIFKRCFAEKEVSDDESLGRFREELESLFKKNNVPWANKPLVPLKLKDE
ncbi:hypothetical protein QSH18_00760 [Xanthomonas sp. NCPPB 2654]|uniref:hypothetical protein n=1 Tax=unclassified Xanthomonas TaxID=2643310 RepID=UPI0021E0523C|nr:MULTISPECIES: hypothetical protein [unclassified Xanthomonas]MDL5364130.1 hypothetical protein [Xanthomonas sp. NCPPB 2654]UYC20876.1 hypothetical protein NUG20_00760 [Xanthomonas sp. CFBP 8443]